MLSLEDAGTLTSLAHKTLKHSLNNTLIHLIKVSISQQLTLSKFPPDSGQMDSFKFFSYKKQQQIELFSF